MLVKEIWKKYCILSLNERFIIYYSLTIFKTNVKPRIRIQKTKPARASVVYKTGEFLPICNWNDHSLINVTV